MMNSIEVSENSCLVEITVKYSWKKSLFALPKVVRQQIVCEVCT